MDIQADLDRKKIAMINNLIPGFPRTVGKVAVNNPIWLAPMAGITFGSLRYFYKELGKAHRIVRPEAFRVSQQTASLPES